MLKKLLAISFLSLFLVTATSCSIFKSALEPEEHERNDFLMGTVVTQKVYGAQGEKAMEEAVQRIKDIEAVMTVNAPGGNVNILNSKAGAEKVKLDNDTYFVLKTAARFSQLSGGAFDVTVGPLVKAWAIITDDPRVPPDSEINELLKLVGYKSIILDDESSTAKLAAKGQLVDLGGIAKGFAGDEVIKVYLKYGIKSAFINLGGNIATLGPRPDGKPWKIGVQDPRSETGGYVGVLDVDNMAVVTSGDYERFFERDGKRYHHIIDPKTGRPAESGLMGVSIVAPASIDADAMSTAAFVLGLDEGRKFIESVDGAGAVFITTDKKIYVTSRLKGIFTFNEANKEYIYEKD